eukprot:scaffold19336_cov16-Tisochrysis_lutea.AAC.2
MHPLRKHEDYQGTNFTKTRVCMWVHMQATATRQAKRARTKTLGKQESSQNARLTPRQGLHVGAYAGGLKGNKDIKRRKEKTMPAKKGCALRTGHG